MLGIADEKKFIDLCRKRSVFDDAELAKHWNYKRNKPFIVNFLSVYSFPKRPNLAKLIELGVIADTHSVPQGFAKISKDDLKCVDSYRIQSRAASRWAVAKKETAVFS